MCPLHNGCCQIGVNELLFEGSSQVFDEEIRGGA